MKEKFKGITTTTYLNRRQVNRLFNKKMNLDEIDDLLFTGKLVKRHAYYQPTEELLKELGIIPRRVRIINTQFGRLAKGNAFVLKEIKEMFDNCGDDSVKILARKYFYKKHNYYYKNDVLIDALTEGQEEYEI